MANQLDGKNVGLRLGDNMELTEVTQILMRFLKGDKIIEIISKINNMDVNEACSCEGTSKKISGGFGQNENHSFLQRYKISHTQN